MFTVKVDCRERFDRKILDTVESKEIKDIRVEQLKVGDFAVYYGDVLLFVIERKTWADLAASIKDGRMADQCIALDAIAKQGVKCFIFVEGKLAAQHGHISRETLETTLNRIMLRYNICVVRTRDPTDTVERAVKMTEDFPTELLVKLYEGGEVKLEKPVETMAGKVADCFAAVPRVTPLTAGQLRKLCTVREAMAGKLVARDLAGVTTPAGAKITAKAAATIIANIASNHTKMLATITGVTIDTAELIVSKFSLATLTSTQLSELVKGKKRLGTTVADRIISILDYASV